VSPSRGLQELFVRWSRSFALWGMPTLLLAPAACGPGESREVERNGASTPIAVRAAPVTDTVLARPIVGDGTVAPKDAIALSFKAGGVVARIMVDPGDPVRRGQLLASLDLKEIDAGLSKARSAVRKAERDLARTQRLYLDSVATQAQWEDSETAAEQARADWNAAAFNRRYAVIVAPSDGTILQRSAEPGENVSPGAPVLVLGSRARGNVVQVGLADRDVVSLRKGDPAAVRFDAFPGESFPGKVNEIAAAADAGTGTYQVEIALDDGGRLTAGLVGRVEIRPSRGAPATLVPVEAILEADGDEATVYVLSPDRSRAERRRVTVAFLNGSQVAVAKGLEDAGAVVTDGAAYLDDGSAVRVAP
jgi:membrane fusion protein, multidrug efflux system